MAMNPVPLPLLTRDQIQRIFKEPALIRAYEALQLNLQNIPSDFSTLSQLVNAVVEVAFVAIAADPDLLPNSRALAVDPSLSLIDSGPGAAVTLALAQIADGQLMANLTGSTAQPTGRSLTAILDAILGNTQGQVIMRNAGTWTVLNPGPLGAVLSSRGAAANLAYYGGVTTLTDAASIAMDASLSPSYRILLTAAIGPARAFGTPANPIDGSTIKVRFKQPAAGVAQTISAWPAAFKWAGGVAGVLSVANNAQDLLELQYDATDATYDARLTLAYA